MITSRWQIWGWINAYCCAFWLCTGGQVRGARLWPELEDDVDRGLGDLSEPAEAGVVGQLPYRCGAGLGAERDPAGPLRWPQAM